MGAAESTQAAGLSKAEKERIKRRFERMTGKGGSISLDDFLRASNLSGNVFVQRIFVHFDRDQDGRISVEDFVTAIESLGKLYSEEEKIRWLFGLYDSDKDGKLSPDDLVGVWSHMGGSGMTQSQLQDVIAAILKEYDTDADGHLSYPEFRHLAAAVGGSEPRPFMGLGTGLSRPRLETS